MIGKIAQKRKLTEKERTKNFSIIITKNFDCIFKEKMLDSLTQLELDNIVINAWLMTFHVCQ